MNNFNNMLNNNNLMRGNTMQPYYTPASVVSTTPTNNIIWVNGIEGAKA